jgi:hypothetical protein
MNKTISRQSFRLRLLCVLSNCGDTFLKSLHSRRQNPLEYRFFNLGEWSPDPSSNVTWIGKGVIIQAMLHMAEWTEVRRCDIRWVWQLWRACHPMSMKEVH